MAAIDRQLALHRLKTMKGHLGSYLTQIWPVVEACGEMPHPPEAMGTKTSTKWGEVLYLNAMVIAMASKNLELLTNELRVEQGKRRLDYKESPASQIIEEHEAFMKEAAESLGLSVTAEGKLVRS